MMTLRQFSQKPETIPASTSWYLADLSKALGRQEFFTKQSPQRLQALKEHALIESAVSSNRIEGVEIEQKRIGTIVFGRSHLRDRNEEEVRGYRNALKLIHERGEKIPFTQETVRKLHALTRGEIWDAGQYKEKESDIIERYPDGRSRIRFKTVSPAQTEPFMKELITLWEEALQEKWVHPLIALAASNLDLLCIHPFRDGNGRVSRLLLLLQAYHLGYEVGRYISLERLIEENKDRYYETLEESSRGWHDGKHDPWPYINYLLFILKEAYKEFEQRSTQSLHIKGGKTALVLSALESLPVEFTVTELEKNCPDVSRELIRKILRDLSKSNKVKCLGRGPGAIWKKKGTTLKRG